MTAVSSRLLNAWPVLLYLVLMPTMLWLGFWQLDKSGQRAQALARYETQLENSETQDAAELIDPEPFSPVSATGEFVADRQLLIDNIVVDGQAGAYVISPMVLSGGRTLLINRGWIPLTSERTSAVPLTVPTEVQTVVGRVGKLPVGGLKLGENPTTTERWPPLLVFPTMAELSSLLERELVGWVLLSTDPLADESERFVRRWTPGGLPPERHMGYAVQWFAMSIALTLLMMGAWWRTRSKNNRE
ncbi:MAG: SURF1 family protein [Pseudomonadota bacterium]